MHSNTFKWCFKMSGPVWVSFAFIHTGGFLFYNCFTYQHVLTFLPFFCALYRVIWNTSILLHILWDCKKNCNLAHFIVLLYMCYCIVYCIRNVLGTILCFSFVVLHHVWPIKSIVSYYNVLHSTAYTFYSKVCKM